MNTGGVKPIHRDGKPMLEIAETPVMTRPFLAQEFGGKPEDYTYYAGVLGWHLGRICGFGRTKDLALLNWSLETGNGNNPQKVREAFHVC